MGINVILFLAIMILLTVLYHMEPAEDGGQIERRKIQTKNMFRENIVEKKIDKIIEERVKKDKIRKTEKLLIQAGLKISYTEFTVVKFLIAIVMGLIFGISMTNPLLGIVFFIIGLLAPIQIVKYLRNKRVELLSNQIGSFMHMVVKRYENTKDFKSALKLTTEELKGEEPIYTELNNTLIDINLGIPITEALGNLAKRTGNKYLTRFASYYGVASESGVAETRRDLMMQAYLQYEEDMDLKRLLQKEISNSKSQSYFMLFMVPLVAVYQSLTNPDYINFMTKTTMGRIGTTIIATVVMLIFWLINNKIAAPLD